MRPTKHLRVATFIFSFSSSLPLAAFAEITNDSLLGLGVRSRPAYDGSDSQRFEAVPVLRYFGQYWFARSTQGLLESGLRVELAPGLHAGAQLAYESGRQTHESDFLETHNVADIHRGASAGVHVEWDRLFDPVPVSVLARTRQNFDSSLGMQADLRVSAGVFQSGPVAAGVFAQTTWANAKSDGAFYGVSPPQSLTTGLPAYAAGPGWLFTSFGLLLSVDLTKNWIVVGSAEARRLRGDAARSPFAERASNYYTSVGVARRF
jgi:outer membrane protein